jgi:PAS domain S-box-containing protein
MTEKPSYEELVNQIKGLEQKVLKLKQIEEGFKQTENALQKSEEKFKTAFRTSPDAINLNYVEDGVYIDINEGFTKLMGYSREDVIGKPSVELNIWYDLKDRERLITGLKKHGLVENLEAAFRKKDGQVRTGLMSARLLSIDNKNTILSITRDITEKNQAEKKLHDSEKRYRRLVENIAEQVWKVDANWVYTYISPRTIDMYGLKPEKVMGKTPFDLMPAKEAKRVGAIFDKILNTREPFRKLENIAQHVDGRQIHMETTGFPFFDNNGDLLGYRGTAIDITERKQNERDTQTLVESTVGILGQELFDNIVVKLCEWLECDCAIIGKIIPGNMVKSISMILDGEPVSNYAYRLKGSPCDETVRECYCAYPENVCALFPDDSDLIEMDAAGYVGVSLADRTGKTIGILCGISRGKLHITKQTKNVMKIIGARIAAEIERIQIEKEKEKLKSKLVQAQKMEAIGTLAGGIAHDFNNILFPIMGHTEMLLGDVPGDSPFKNSLNSIYTGALRARDLVKQILTFSRQERSELKLIKIKPVVMETLKFIRSSIPATIDIKQDIDTDCGVIKADPTQIHQIVMNLTTNAYHAMEKTGGELKVSLKEIELSEYDLITPDMTPGAYACLTVADTGAGMDTNLTGKIFNPFFTTKEKGKGTGMGLSVVHGIVNGMGGTIHVYSEPGKGSKFHVYIPMEKGSFEKQVISSKAEIPGGTEQILLVDDENDIITMERQILERLGYRVTSRTSSIEALEAFRANPDRFDLIITDMAMPNMPGDKLSAELVKICPDIPILLCTGFSENMSEEQATSLGIKGFLLKPIVMKDLAQKIREVLDERTLKVSLL